jgi:hypothetical protein
LKTSTSGPQRGKITELNEAEALATAQRERQANYDLYVQAIRERDEWKEWCHSQGEALAAARALDDLIPTTQAYLFDAEFHAAAYVLHEALASLSDIPGAAE